MDYNKLYVFCGAARSGGFSNTELNLSPSVVSRHVADLENDFGFKLFVRTPKGLLLTPQGQQIYQEASECFQKLRATQDLVSSNDGEVEQELDIIMPTAWASGILVQYVAAFIKRFPHICLNIITDDSKPNVEAVGTNFTRVAILPYAPKDQSLMRRFLVNFTLGMYASESYLAEYGVPKSFSDLKGHKFIASSGRDINFMDLDWHLRIGMPEGESRKPLMKLNNMAFAAGEGLGIASLSEGNLDIGYHKLVRVLPDIKGPTSSAYYVYPEYIRHSPAVKTFGDFLVEVVTGKLT